MWTSRSLRLVVGVALVVLALAEMQSVVLGLQSHARLRARALASMTGCLTASRQRLAELLQPGGHEAWMRALRVVHGACGASEVEVLDLEGKRMASFPADAPVQHSLAAAAALPLGGDNPVALGPVAGGGGRILGYAAFVSGARPLLLRVASEAPDLADDLRDRRRVLTGQIIAILALLLAAVVGVTTVRSKEATAPYALDAYEAAMGRLRQREDDLAREHDAERDQLTRRMQDREAMARAGELTAGIVHEVRNGLGTVVGYARMIEREAASGTSSEAALHIREECETLEVVIRRFMDFVRRESLNLAPFDLDRLVQRVAAREGRGRAGGAIGQPTGVAGTIVGDEEMLERALENLVRNARDAAGGSGHVEIHLVREASTARVEISDDGPGLSSESRAKMRPFFTTKPGGLGLGLPIALKIVELHSGLLMFESRPSGGLKVILTVPTAGPGNDQDSYE